MKQTIEELWSGNLSPWEHCGRNSAEVQERIRLLSRNKEALKKELSDSQNAMLEKCIDIYEEYVYRMAEQAFCEGVSLACKLMAEAQV